jgi:hypothetical protein
MFVRLRHRCRQLPSSHGRDAREQEIPISDQAIFTGHVVAQGKWYPLQSSNQAIQKFRVEDRNLGVPR